LHAFPPVTPALAHERALLARCDCKFLVPLAGVRGLLGALAGSYAAFRAGGAAIARYRSTYLDTPDLACVRDHVRVRIREYLDRDVAFLEIKHRRDERSEKQRLAVAVASATLGMRERAFLRRRLGDGADALIPTAEITYRRIGLVGIASDDRVSIDLDVAVAGGAWPFPDHAIVEVKRAHAGVASPARAVLGDRPAVQLSKYTTAIAATMAAA